MADEELDETEFIVKNLDTGDEVQLDVAQEYCEGLGEYATFEPR